MVQYKRKPVTFEPPSPFINDSTEVWGIEETGEVFMDYDKYLARRDFYQQKHFTCEATGHSSYTYFEALKSEAEASKEINSIFPEGLRARVLEYVQFRNTARMDDLVNVVFDHFKEDFMIGDKVTTEGDNARRHGVITQMTDTSRLHNIFTAQNTDDSFRTYTYVITMDDDGTQITKYKASELQRDKKVYSKLVLKQFLRGAVSREAWNGAPWTIKDHLAKRYNISTKVPEAKTRDAVIAARKAANVTNNGGLPLQPSHSHGLNGHTYLVNGHGQVLGQGQTTFVNFSGNPPYGHDLANGMVQPVDGHYPPNVAQLTLMNGRAAYPLSAGPPPLSTGNLAPHLAHLAQQLPPPGPGFLPISVPFQNNFMQYQTLPPSDMIQVPPSKPFEPIKYPIEDLEIRQPRANVRRPPLKFFSDDVPEGVEEPPEDKKTGIKMKSIGPLLCAWETLNVHDTIYSLDSFTLDDFVDAMCFSSEEIDCELLVEVHCSVLKQIVDDEGKLLAPLPHVTESDESDEDEESSREPTPEPEPPVRTTRSSLRKSEANQLAKQRTSTPEPPKQLHNAAEFLSEFDWIERCQTRNFRDGGWEAILVGLLHRLSFDDTQKDRCEEILAALCPPDEDEPTLETIAYNYVYLDVNLRITALDIALGLTVATEAFREQLTAASLDMTKLRKEKIEFQRKRKELADELFKLDIERKIQLPANTPASPGASKEKQDVPMTGTDENQDATEPEPEPEAESSEEPTVANRKLRHTNKNKRKAEAEAAKKEKAKKAKAEAAKTKQQKEWEKLLNAIEKKKDELKSCEASINELDDDLRESLVHRSKVLGKDRFLNKYYWFEHNGMPFGGVPNSSTAEYGYANGRIWVQGPDEYEFQPNLEEPALSQDKEKFGFTVPERKAEEEGDTHLSKSTDWGYYDDPEDIDKLMAWLDDRGVREKALRKELQAYRDRIAEYMIKMKEHLTEAEKSKAEGEENATRVSTRTKTYVDKDTTKDRCLLWTNSIMREDSGYSHFEEYEPPRKSKGRASKAKAKSKK